MRSGLRSGTRVAMIMPISPTPARVANVTSFEVSWNSIAPAVTAIRLPSRWPELKNPISLPRIADVPTPNAVSCAASRMCEYATPHRARARSSNTRPLPRPYVSVVREPAAMEATNGQRTPNRWYTEAAKALLMRRMKRLTLSASPIQKDAAKPNWSPAPNSTAATGRTTYISESPMITAAVGATAYTIPAGMIGLMRMIGVCQSSRWPTPRNASGTNQPGTTCRLTLAEGHRWRSATSLEER